MKNNETSRQKDETKHCTHPKILDYAHSMYTKEEIIDKIGNGFSGSVTLIELLKYIKDEF